MAADEVLKCFNDLIKKEINKKKFSQQNKLLKESAMLVWIVWRDDDETCV